MITIFLNINEAKVVVELCNNNNKPNQCSILLQITTIHAQED